MSVEMAFNEDARKKLQNGIDLVTKAVAVTLGPRGKTVIIHNENGFPIISKDGLTVVKSITSVESEYETLGILLTKQASSRVNEICGDGSTSTCVILQSLVSSGLKYVANSANPLSLKRGMDKALEVILKLVDESAKSISSKEEITQVASISGNSLEVGEIISEAIEKIGDGIITLEESTSRETQFELVEGFTFTNGYTSPYFITDSSKNIATYKDVIVLLFAQEIKSFDVLIPALEKLSKTQKPVLIIAENFSPEFTQALAINKVRGQKPWIAVKTPGFGNQKKENIYDINSKVSGLVFNEELGHKYEELSEEFYGYAKKIIVSHNSTTIIEGRTNDEMLSDRLTLLKNLLEVEESEYNREKINERIGRLSDGVGIIRVGASTEAELKEKMYRFEDSLNASRAAIAEGIVIGGGACLLKLSGQIENLVEVDERDPDEKLGVKIMAEAMKSIFKQICINGNFSPDILSQKVTESGPETGLDAKYGDEICDLFERGVLDPCKLVKTTLEVATSIASLVLTTECLIVPIPDNNTKFLMSDPYQ